jgi:hypothetical protein
LASTQGTADLVDTLLCAAAIIGGALVDVMAVLTASFKAGSTLASKTTRQICTVCMDMAAMGSGGTFVD